MLAFTAARKGGSFFFEGGRFQITSLRSTLKRETANQKDSRNQPRRAVFEAAK
jgi:hypothetical protein